MSPGAVLLVPAVMLMTSAGARSLIVLVSRVTAPLTASARPSMVAPVVAVIDARARMFPGSAELRDHPAWISNPWQPWESRLPAPGELLALDPARLRDLNLALLPLG